jgi:hypothetical protein
LHDTAVFGYCFSNKFHFIVGEIISLYAITEMAAGDYILPYIALTVINSINSLVIGAAVPFPQFIFW